MLRDQCVVFQRLYHQTPAEQDDTFSKLAGHVRRDADGALAIEGVDTDTFQRLSDFLYQGIVPAVTPAWVMERKLYYLADVLGATELMNRLTDALQEYHLLTDSHFLIYQVRQILPVLNGTGVWGYCLAGMAYQVACNLYREGDESFEELCRDHPELWEIILLEVKEHGTAFQGGRDYRRRAVRGGRGAAPCEFHVHPPQTACHLDSSRESSLDERAGHFPGRYAVENGKLEFEFAEDIGLSEPAVGGGRRRDRERRMGDGRVTKRARQTARRGGRAPMMGRHIVVQRRPRTRV